MKVADNKEFLFEKFINGLSFIYCDVDVWPRDISNEYQPSVQYALADRGRYPYVANNTDVQSSLAHYAVADREGNDDSIILSTNV